jgi:hypothetical protein
MEGRFIKGLKEFEPVNEGFFKSLFGGIASSFKSKRSKINSLLNDIKKAKNEDLDHRIEIEKQIAEIPKENSPEYRFNLANLNRQIRIYTALKEKEVNDLTKEAEKISGDNPKLSAYFSSELAKIQAESTKKLIRNLSSYREKNYLDQLTSEFEKLVKDANRKSEYYEKYEDYEPEPKEVGKAEIKIDSDVNDFISMDNTSARNYIEELTYKELQNMHLKVKDLQFQIEFKMNTRLSKNKEEVKKAEREGDDYIIPSLKREESMIKHDYKEPLAITRSRILMIEKEMRNKRYGATVN